MIPFILICIFIAFIVVAFARNQEIEIDDTKQNNTSTSNDYLSKAKRNNTNTSNNYLSEAKRDTIFNKFEKYDEYCSDTQAFFEENFNINQRITRLRNCIKKIDSIKEYCLNLGDAGKREFEFEVDIRKIFENWSESSIITNANGDNYRFEFQNIEFTNYNFLTYLLNLYTDNTEEQKAHLKQEEKYSIIYSYGGTEAYMEEMKFQEEKKEMEEYIASIKKTLRKKLQTNGSYIQSKLIKDFAEDDKVYVRKLLKEMEAANEISKVKHGNSYMITYNGNK